MINSGSLDKIRRSVVTKIAGLFVLAVLAVAFFVFPLSTFAASLPTVQLVGVPTECGFVTSAEVDRNGTWPYMYAPYLDHSVKVSGLNPSNFINVLLPDGQHAIGMFLNKQTHEAVIINNGKPQFVTVTDGGSTISNPNSSSNPNSTSNPNGTN